MAGSFEISCASRFALGTVQFGLKYGIANKKEGVSDDEVSAIMKYSQREGLDTLDTAVMYGDSEQRLGLFGVSNWNVISKLPAVPDECSCVSDWMMTQVNDSLERLKIDKLYGLLLHRPYQLKGKNAKKIIRSLQQLKEKGLVQKIGISIYDPEELDALDFLCDLDIVQAPFNILDHRLIHSGWLDRLHSQGVEVHARSIFLQGLLLMGKEARPLKFHRWQEMWSLWDKWLVDTGLTPLQACVRYVMKFAQINKVLIGVDTLQQLTEIIKSTDGIIPQVPDAFDISDQDLVNPAKWDALV
ncbi:MAG: aldo/keto reductase [Desulfotalea sp.]